MRNIFSAVHFCCNAASGWPVSIHYTYIGGILSFNTHMENVKQCVFTLLICCMFRSIVCHSFCSHIISKKKMTLCLISSFLWVLLLGEDGCWFDRFFFCCFDLTSVGLFVQELHRKFDWELLLFMFYEIFFTLTSNLWNLSK